MEMKYCNNIPIKIIKDPKFKNILINFVFLTPFTKATATHYSLLRGVLATSCKKYNTNEKMHQITGKLYGSYVSINNRYSYKTRITTIYLKMPNPKYIPDENIMDEALDFLYEIIFRPNASNKKFDQKLFEKEKRMLHNCILSSFNNKKSLALDNMLNHMCKDDVINIKSMGTIEDLDVMTSESLYDVYLDLLNNSKKIIYVQGDVDDSICDKLQKFNKIESQDIDLEYKMIENKEVQGEKEIIEEANINQSSLILGYRTTINNYDKRVDAFNVFKTMLGDMTSSTLHQVVREKHNLCYSIYARAFINYKIFVIRAGIDKKNYEKTVKLIKEEIENYRNGKFDENLINMAKIDIINVYKSINDFLGDIINLEINKDMLEKDDNIEDIINKINSVTKEDIINVAKDIKLDTIYMLANE